MVKRSLTDAAVMRLKPPAEGQIDIFDQGYPGFAIRISYGGGKTFVYFYKLGGRLRRMSLGRYPSTSLADAREAWRKARQDAQKGRDPSTARNREGGATDFGNVFEEWLKRDQAGNRTVDAVRRLIEKDAMPAWAHRQVVDLDRRDVLDVIDAVVDRGSPVTARRLHSHLHRFFRWCVGRGILDANPMADLPKPGNETKRERVLTDDELLAVWNAAEKLGWPFGPITQLLMLTGARRSEIGRLQWSEISGGQICLSGERTKNGESHNIALSSPASAIIEKLPRIDKSALVFTTTGRTPVSGWSNAKTSLDELSAPWTLHDLRRTVATGLQKLGVSLQVIEAVLGHVSGSRAGVVGIYQRHQFLDEARAALEAWGAHIVAIVEGGKPGKVLPLRGKR